jgi:hypothetical protein
LVRPLWPPPITITSYLGFEPLATDGIDQMTRASGK